MVETYTPTLNLTKPGINESDDTWGTKWNSNADKIDANAAATDGDITALKARCAALETEAAKASWVGEIRMHSGTIASIANIPGGVWKLCDGTNGTPNLVDKMVLGAGTGVAVGATGGAKSWTGTVADKVLTGLKAVGRALTTAQMPSHAHVGTGRTSDDGEHDHGLPGAYSNGGLPGSNRVGNQLYVGGEHGQDGNTNPGGRHGHNFTVATDAQGGGQAHDHDLPSLTHNHSATVPTVPPYYALAFVKRTA